MAQFEYFDGTNWNQFLKGTYSNNNTQFLRGDGAWINPFSNDVSIFGNAQILSLYGTDHCYIGFFPRSGESRKGYIGFPSAGSNVIQIVNQDTGSIQFVINSVNCINLFSSFISTNVDMNMNNNYIYNLRDANSDQDAINLRQLKQYSGRTSSIQTTYTIYANSGNNNYAYYGGNYLTNIAITAIQPQQYGAWHGYGIIAQWDIAASNFFAYSSKKIKNIIERDKTIIENEVIDLVKKLPIVKYQHKDDNPESNYYGIIAEELSEIDATLVKPNKRYIPNIISIAYVESIDKKKYKLTLAKNHDEYEYFESNKIKLNNHDEAEILEINNNELIISSEKELDIKDNKVFVYGSYEECPNVNKERLFEMSLAVIQNLLNRVEKLEKGNLYG